MRYSYAGKIPTTTLSRSYSSSALSALYLLHYSSFAGPIPPGARNSMRFWYLCSRAVSDSRSMSLLRVLWRLCAPVVFLAIALLWSIFSIASDYEYRLGMATGNPDYFVKAAALFPIMRERREGPLWAYINYGDLSKIPYVAQIVAEDPNAADLNLALARMLLMAGDKEAYNVVMTRLQKLTPNIRYQVVQIVPAQPR